MNNLKNIFTDFYKCIDTKCKNISSSKELINMQMENLKKVKKRCSKKNKNEINKNLCINKEQTKYINYNKKFVKKSREFKKCGDKLCSKESGLLKKLLLNK